jgi:serine/threonine-protein kinase PRP4
MLLCERSVSSYPATLYRDTSPEIDYELQTEEEEARLIEERRRQRQNILRKHLEQANSNQSSPAPSDGITPPATSNTEVKSTTSTRSASPQDELKGTFEVEKDGDDIQAAQPSHKDSEMSAADYDPSMDRALDNERAVKLIGQAPRQEEAIDRDEDSEYEEIEVDDEDDVEDMFALDEDKPAKKKIRVKKGRSEAEKKTDETSTLPAAVAGLHDNWDDADGYYKITLGERIGENARYQVFANLGRGMFSSVVKARDLSEGANGRELAIKIIRSQETMYKAGIKEIAILTKLAELDVDDKRHMIRLLGHFEHRKHLCMVFESLSMNLREVIKRFGKDVGLNLRAVRAYAHQMFLSLSLLRKAEIMHADIKPDNILVNENKTVLKMCDLGSASDLTEMEITPYLVSRFYRAPEIILGLPYDCALDMWSIGCTLYEVFSGKILFPGKTNNHMLLLMQELKGKFSTKQIRKGRFARMHFDEQNHFMSREKDKNTGAEVMRKVTTFPTSDLKTRMLPANAAKVMSTSDFRLTNSFIDLLNRILDLDPARRLTPNQALQHPFFSG